MLTLRLGMFQMQPERAQELADAIVRQKGSCDEVWLTTLGYYPSLEYHAELAEKWVEPARIFRKAGVRVALQVANTVGHRDWDSLRPEKNSFLMEGMTVDGEPRDVLVGPDGAKCWSCFCWRGESFRKYINGLVKTYCEKIQPYCLWLDDDLRPFAHFTVKYGCFCDNCMKIFNEQSGTSYTREELAREINYGDVSVREKFLGFTKQGVREFLFELVAACHEVSPDTHFGFEYGHMADYPAMNENYIIEALHDASGKPVELRPGGGFYNDKAPFGEYNKAMFLSAEYSDLPECVSEVKAELENLPGVAFGKSLGGIINEGTLDLAYGCTGLTFTDVQSCHEPMAYYERLFKRCADIRHYWEKLSAVTRRTYRGGASVYRSPKANLKKLGEGDAPFSWSAIPAESNYNWFRIGLSITYEKRGASVYILNNFDVYSLTDEDIEFLLENPVVADAESVQALIDRGYGDRFYFTLDRAYDDDAMEYYTDHPVNRGWVGCFMHENPYATKPMKRFCFENVGENTEIIGEMKTNSILSDSRYIGPSAVITKIKTKTGREARWAIFGYSIWSDLISAGKRNQIAGALDAIAPMPARLLGEEQAALIPSVTEDKKCAAVTVSSVSQGGTDEMRLIVRRPEGKSITAYTSRLRNYEPKIIEDRGQELLVLLPPIDPYELVTLFFE